MSKKTFGEELRRLRRKSGPDKTLVKLADAIGHSVVYISDIERGRRNPPSPVKIEKMLRVIGAESKLNEMLRLAAEARRSVEIPVEGKSQEVTEALVALAREADSGVLDNEMARKIQRLLKERKQK